jgi:mevalonate kinase
MAAASAPGKLILYGEHAVVFGEPALSTAIDLRTEVYARPHEVWLADGMSLDEPRYRYLKAAAGRAWSGRPLWFEVRSMIPMGSGLGSSAAVTVAALGALQSLQGRFDPPEIARTGFEVEHEVQGRASPIDTSTATAGAGVLVRRDEGDGLLWTIRKDARSWSLHRCDLPDLTFVVGDSGISAATGPLVAGVKARVDRDPKAAERVREIGGITMEGLAALRRKDLVAAGRLMDRNHELLNALGVGHPALDKLVSAVRPLAFGAKLTGAGGGGSIVALTDRPEAAAKAIEAAGGRAYLVTSEREGVRRLP